MTRRVEVARLPTALLQMDLHRSTAVVIDVLRASTTLCCAVEAGARRIVLTEHVDEARRMQREHAGALLGGERGGLLIEGFDLSNSPREYTRERVAGREVIFTTTNGTRAAAACRGAARVLVGCFRNLQRVAEEAWQGGGAMVLVCAGTDSGRSEEDERFAGALAGELMVRGAVCVGQETQGVLAEWRGLLAGRSVSEAARLAVESSAHAARLRGLGLGEDVAFCAEVDRTSVVPEVRGGVIEGPV